ncbi:MAG: hypothetical protein P8K10_07430 [Crocinitomicaceae bacterium]|nr:hypothetical protein [Crocinitomicaceae bacterium]
MKVLLFISTLILVVSCGKYERPFISFQSPETRLVDKTWGCTKAVSEDGTEFEIEDRITFSSDGTFERITSHWPLNPLYYTIAPDQSVLDTIQGTWTWGQALEGEVNEQFIIVKYDGYTVFGRNNFVSVLSKKELVYQDQSYDNATYHYKKL